MVLLATLLIAFVLVLREARKGSYQRTSMMCNVPTRRQEWRSLQASEQQEYIRAVLCLMNKESNLNPGTYRYDDFAYAHTTEGTITHYAAAFLPWHRYFIHTFEIALVEECGYRGLLT